MGGRVACSRAVWQAVRQLALQSVAAAAAAAAVAAAAGAPLAVHAAVTGVGGIAPGVRGAAAAATAAAAELAGDIGKLPAHALAAGMQAPVACMQQFCSVGIHGLEVTAETLPATLRRTHKLWRSCTAGVKRGSTR